MSEKVEIKKCTTHERGMHANNNIKKGEIVFIKGGHILRKNQIYSSGIINSYHPIDDNYFIAAKNEDEEEYIKLYINHSCFPNCGLRGEITFVALKDIKKGGQLTIDYAFLDNEDYSFKCECGESCCRSVITGRDWKIKEIQDRYFEYFAEYLKQKIIAER